MKTKAKAATYGIVGLALAGIMLFAGSFLGVLGPTSGLNLGSRGSVSILLTDPPSVPEGVSAVYVSYSNLALHVTNLGDSGWVTMQGHGTVETMGLVNLSQTISAGNVPSGRYNLLVFNISSAEVKYLGTNYSATVNSGKLMVPIVGGLEVNSSAPAAALVDIQPTVLNLGNATGPDFVITTGAKALQLPQREVVEAMRHLGYTASLAGRGWFHSFVATHSNDLTISGLSLSAHSFSFTASNPGSDAVVIRLVMLTTASPGVRSASVLTHIAGSVVFSIGPDGSLRLLSSGAGRGSHGDMMSALSSDGYQLSGGSTMNFSYSGTISGMMSAAGISSGFTYYVVIMGSHIVSLQTVTAG